MNDAIELLPDATIGSGGLRLRRWSREDAEVLGQAVLESADHLRPWMAWVADEPVSLSILFVLERVHVGGTGIDPTGIAGVHNLGMSILRKFRGQGWGPCVQSALNEARTRGLRKM